MLTGLWGALLDNRRIVHGDMLDKVWYLRLYDKIVSVKIARNFSSTVLAPGEEAPLHHLYVLERGMVLYRGAALSHGKLWGTEDVALTDALLHFAHLDRAQAMTFTECRHLSRNALHEVVSTDIVARRVMRRTAVFIATKRFIINAAKDVRQRVKEANNQEVRGDLLQYMAKAMRQPKEGGSFGKLADRMQSAKGQTYTYSGSAAAGETGTGGDGHAMLHITHELKGLTAVVSQLIQSVSTMDNSHRHLRHELADIKEQLSTRQRKPNSAKDIKPHHRAQQLGPSLERSKTLPNGNGQPRRYEPPPDFGGLKGRQSPPHTASGSDDQHPPEKDLASPRIRRRVPRLAPNSTSSACSCRFSLRGPRSPTTRTFPPAKDKHHH